MSERPDPLTPAECTMSGNDWFPLYPARLRKSKWWRRASDLARARNVMLWGEAFQAQPAGSLPDDDDDLAEAAGFGMDVDAFLAVKPELLAPWLLCSDGRWYHPTICEVVLDVWERSSDRKRASAERQRRRREKVRGRGPKEPVVTPAKADVTRDSADLPRDIDIQTLPTGHVEANASLSPAGDESHPAEKESPELFESLWKAYPHVKGRSSKVKALGLWRRLAKDVRAALPAAAARYAREGREPRMDCGAPAMDRWLRDAKYADWMVQAVATAPAAKAAPGDKWRAALRRFKIGGYWDTTDHGPKPGKPGCEVPTEILAEFDLAPAEVTGEIVPFPLATDRDVA